MFFFFLLLSFAFSGSAQNQIISFEYWFDGDYSTHYNQSVSPQPQYLLSATINTAGLTGGLHTVSVRFQQTSGFWSSPVQSFFFKMGESTTAPNLINAYRYWTEGMDTVVTIVIATPINQLDLNVSLDLSWARKGNNLLYIQCRDLQDNWSVAAIDSFYKVPRMTIGFSTPDTMICDRDSVHFENSSVDGDTYLWDFGDGYTSNLETPVHYYQPGTYSVSLTVSDTTAGADSVLVKNDYITVLPGAHASYTMMQNNLQVVFTNNSTNALSYLWDFGDGNTSTNVNPVHQYLHDGNYTVVLSVYDSCGVVSDTQFVSIILHAFENEVKNSFAIFNNNAKAVITFNDDFKNCNYTLINTTGQVFFLNNLKRVNKGSTAGFSLESLSQGVYFLHINADDLSMTKLIYKF